MTPTLPYKPNILILGQSGTGKTSSLRNIPRDNTTHIIDMESKGLPFKGTFAVHKNPTTFKEAETALRESLADPICKLIIFESLSQYGEVSVSMCRKAFANYDIWSNHSINIATILSLFRSREKYIVVTGIDELVMGMSESGGATQVRRASIFAGKEWEGKVEGKFTITLFTSPKRMVRLSIDF